MNRGICSFLIMIFFLLLSSDLFAAEAAKKPTGPITITSEKLTADNKARTALFEKSVTAKTKDMTIRAERMLVHYAKDTGNVTRIDAEGKVNLVREGRVITSHAATYLAEGEKVIFTGEPRAVEGENVITGSKMTYFMAEDRFLVDNSKVFLTKKRNEGP